MNIWILTIGSSDVQLKPKNNWTNLFRAGRNQLKSDRGFSPVKDPFEDRLRVPARVMGTIYSQPQAELDELTFPLIDNFISKLKDQTIDKIILILSDQSVFSETKRTQNHPYWQDTCTLQPILEKYLIEKFKDKSNDLKIHPLILEAFAEDQGLDDWNIVLKLVQDKFSSSDLNFPESSTIYVSHQAGTPAISSAIQFTSLSQFGKQVEFLVSNERDSQLTRLIGSSEYLKGIRKKEAETLLKRRDYSGVQELVKPYLKDDDTKILLNAAVQWNFAKFDQFLIELQNLSDQKLQNLLQEVRTGEQDWWWLGYEAAYLAFARLDQNNAVEAFFHSFRAVEGLISKWAEVHFSEYIDPNNDSPKLKASILEVPNLNYFRKKKYEEHKEKLEKEGFVILSGFPLYSLLRAAKPNWKKDCNEIIDFIEKISPIRNKIFHRLRGLEIDDVFKFWLVDEAENIQERKLILEKKILKYLNFVSSKSFVSLKEASLMSKVHAELKKTIENL